MTGSKRVEIFRQQALPERAERQRVSDNLIKASPHCNGWNRPAARQGGVGRPLLRYQHELGEYPIAEGSRDKGKRHKDQQNLHHSTQQIVSHSLVYLACFVHPSSKT